ncbi:MAG TPA: hypothetical protein VK806_08025 [Bacteroidia bacterium]|jgi:hypothetical protein|nr:hypothetical protein [Bacteroidia bacterium]
MKRISLPMLLLSCALFFASAPAKAQSLTKRNLAKDLDGYCDQMIVYDRDPFKKIRKEDFIKEIDQIKKDTATKNIDELLVELMKANADLMDEHSEISTGDYKVLPYRFYWFKEGIYVNQTEVGNDKALYSKLIAINNVPVEEIVKRLSTLLPDKNDGYMKEYGLEMIRRDRVLHGLGIVLNTDKIEMTLLSSSNDTLHQRTSFLKRGTPNWDKLGRGKKYLRYKGRTNYWFEYEAKDNYLYVYYGSCEPDQTYSFEKFVAEVSAEAEAKNPSKIVIDLRDNAGGERPLIKPFTMWLYKSRFNKPKCIYVLIGRTTFSAGMNNIYDLKRVLPAITVGESTGGSINHMGQPEDFTLPNTGLQARYSTNFIVNIEDATGPTLPDVEIPETLYDYKNFIDAALNYVIKQ